MVTDGLRAAQDVLGVRRSKKTQLPADGNVTIEHRLLRVRVFRQNQQRLGIEWRKLVRIGRLYRGCDPCLIIAELLPYSSQQWRGIVLEIEMQDDQRPCVAPILFQRLFDDRPDSLK